MRFKLTSVCLSGFEFVRNHIGYFVHNWLTRNSLFNSCYVSKSSGQGFLSTNFVNHLTSQPFEIIENVFINRFQMMEKIDSYSVENIVRLGRTDVFESNICYFFNVSKQVFLTFQVNCQTNSFFSSTTSSTWSVNVIINFFRRF